MKYFRHSADKKKLTIYPLVCLHVGAPESDTKFIKEHVKRIKEDPDGVAVYMGDAGECTTIASKGDIYTQSLNPGQQMLAAVDILDPIRNKILFGIKGNHGNRIYKETGLDWDETFCYRLGIPYLGQSAFMQLNLRGSKNRSCVVYSCYFHHGSGGSINIGGKINKALKINNQFDADALFTAHSHICVENPVETVAYLPPKKAKVAWKTKHSYICGCAYDSRGGYAEERQYSPILPAYLGVTFNGVDKSDGGSKIKATKATAEVNKRQECRIWRVKP